ncbi:ABC-2 type transport system permease protein [Chitinophaga sp. YR627]|nr:ABC-2 type transport system permease protein [Chitinophaga sp. YR627]
MNISTTKLFAAQIYWNTLKNKALRVLLGIVALLIIYAAFSGALIYQEQTQTRQHYQHEVRTNWEKMPDKHPHRMAHYGYIVFRPKHLLSVFDYGMESFTGNAVFLEAHRQNSANFSEAGFSTGMLRFGEISMSMILQVLVPLVIFFIGFGAIATDRENGTLKMLLSQGATWKEILTGKAIGLLGIAVSVLLFAVVVLLVACLGIAGSQINGDDILRIGTVLLTYTLYFSIICLLTVIISAVSRTAKFSLVILIGIWLTAVVIFPRTAQAIGNFLYHTPSRIAFEAAVEKDLIKKGDSHNPDDPYYKALKDSVLKAYHVQSVDELPFNYGGFQMKEGERLSADIYNQHLAGLLGIYQQQNNVLRLSAIVNPFTALRNLSMAVSGTDFQSYTGFQQQAETYRYALAQHMNDLQIKYISNKKPDDHDHPPSISKAHWKEFPDFAYQRASLGTVMYHELWSLLALLCWTAGLLLLIKLLSNKLKAI